MRRGSDSAGSESGGWVGAISHMWQAPGSTCLGGCDYDRDGGTIGTTVQIMHSQHVSQCLSNDLPAEKLKSRKESG
jgi:hypothetical protein